MCLGFLYPLRCFTSKLNMTTMAVSMNNTEYVNEVVIHDSGFGTLLMELRLLIKEILNVGS